MQVTDSMTAIFIRKFYHDMDDENLGDYLNSFPIRNNVKAALEAVFASLEPKKQTLLEHFHSRKIKPMSLQDMIILSEYLEKNK